jgi:hypothetical protein
VQAGASVAKEGQSHRAIPVGSNQSHMDSSGVGRGKGKLTLIEFCGDSPVNTYLFRGH